MSERIKPSIIILVAFILVALSLACVSFYYLQDAQKKNAALQDQLEEIKTRQRMNENRLEESKKMIGVLENKLKDAQDQINILNSELQQEKSGKEEALSKIDGLRQDLEQQKKLRTDLENKFNLAQEESKKVQLRLHDLDAKKSQLETKVKELEEKEKEKAKTAASAGVELGTIVVNPESGYSNAPAAEAVPASVVVPAAPLKPGKIKPQPAAKKVEAPAIDKNIPDTTGIDAKVLVVNKDYNFAVINMGSKDGVRIGNEFSVYHENKYLGDVKVEKVHDSMAAVGFLVQGLRDKINEGDKIVPKSK